jgi:hypothetical protein
MVDSFDPPKNLNKWPLAMFHCFKKIVKSPKPDINLSSQKYSKSYKYGKQEDSAPMLMVKVLYSF